MAELALAAASPVVEMVVKKLASRFWKELGLVRSVRTDGEKLQSKLSTIQNVLEDAERRSILNKALRVWLRKLRDWTLDAEDVVEEFETEALRRTVERYDRIAVKVCNFFSSTNNPIAFRYKMGRKIKDIRERLDEIEKESRAFDLIEKSHLDDRPLDRETVSLVDESEIFGRDGDKSEVIKYLVDRDNGKNISILPIVGLGGVGKTTLAQLVYNDERIRKQFELRMWVCVDENFDLKVVSRAMVEQVKGRDSDHTLNLDIMLSFLQENLRTKKFLLVLDDVWIQKESEWDKLKPLFYQAKQGSKIIITTRMENIAYIIGTASSYRLQELKLDDCWTIFRNRAFRFEREEENPELVEIGKEIIKKCGGLPLAARALGSLMSSRRGKVEWQAIRDNEIWKLPLDEIGVIPTLKLSYDHLPSHLKRCFTYCSIFPKNHIFEIKKLIQLWMAEGLIDTSDTLLHAEDIGYQYFRSLLSRSFFQDVQMDKYDNIYKCRMHDLVHGLAYSLTIDESLVMKIGRENIPHGCRYLLVMCDELSTTLKATYEAKKLRSLILLMKKFYTIINIDEFIFNIPKKFTQLHALDLSNSDIKKLSNRISKLKHLRLLDLSRTEITTLPTSITKLYNLQTLNLQGCSDLEELPEGIGNLTNLRHIDISECYSLSRMPRGLGRLQNLQTLSMFIVGQENGRTIMELEHLNSIQGKLEIKDLHHVKDPNEAIQANLKAKTRLNSLILEWKIGLDEALGPSSIDVEVEELERLQPHHNLKKLVIDGYMGSRLPHWMSSSLTNLVRLSLRGLGRCAYLPPLGQLPSLKYLSMDRMYAMRRIGAEFYGDGGDFAFPSLIKLKIELMIDLEEWETEPIMAERKIATFPILTRLSIKFCYKLTMQPCIPRSVQDLKIEYSNEMLLSTESLAGLSQLKSLGILSCGVSSSSSCKWWDGLQYLTALDSLLIEDCEELTCLPEGIMYMPSLQHLSLVENNNLRSLEWEERKKQQPTPFLTALQYLNIEAADALTTLPEWIGGLTSLQRLIIEECPNLAMLPDGLQHLTTLQYLEIINCPKLVRRCEKETGEDWHKIAHIPNIIIQQEEDGSEEEDEEDESEEEDEEESSK